MGAPGLTQLFWVGWLLGGSPLGPSCWADWLGDLNLDPWYPQYPPFLDWGSDSPLGGKSICMETIDFKYRWAVNGRLFQHVFF